MPAIAELREAIRNAEVGVLGEISGIESASFLSPAQKANIFYGNAARFLRISERSP